MSRSVLRSKWMRKNYSDPYVSYTRRNMKDPNRNPHRLDEVSKNHPLFAEEVPQYPQDCDIENPALYEESPK